MIRAAKPQDPPFEFPNGWRDDGRSFIKDDEGPVIMMGYCGPTPDGEISDCLWMVANETPSRVHPADKYVYQRYREVTGKA